jgi:CheY-like chemotaxis protein
MVYGFVKQSGGHVEIASELGRGTTICIYLPRVAVPDDAVVEAPAPVAERGNHCETILVAEDDADVRVYTIEMLRELGYRVLEAADGDGALRLLAGDATIHLLLTDVVMPGMSGSELADRARRLLPGLKVLFTSGYTREAIMRDGRIAPGVDLLPKPFTFVSLAAKVRTLLDRR